MGKDNQQEDFSQPHHPAGWQGDNAAGLNLSAGEIEKLINELKLRQRELDLQNKELAESKNLYADLVANQSVGIYRILVHKPKSGEPISDTIQMEFASERFCVLLDIDPLLPLNEIGKLVFNRIHPEDFSSFIASNEVAIGSNTAYTWEGRIMTKEGLKWMRFESSPRQLGMGSTRWTGVTLDITERKLADEKTQLVLLRLRRFLDSDIIGVVIARSDGEMIEANDYYLKVIGYSRNEFIHHEVNWREITPADWIESDENSIRELRSKGFCTPYNKEYLRRDGTRVAVLITNTLLPGPEEHIAGFILDITERLKSEEVVRESELRLNKTQEIAHLGSWELDILTGKLIWSDEVYRIFGLLPQEFAATHHAFMESVHPEDREALNNAYFDSVSKNKDNYEITHRIIRKNSGEIRYVHEKAKHIRDAAGAIIRSSGMVHDITEIKLASDNLKRSEELLRNTQNLAKVGGWEWNVEKQTMFWTEELYRLHDFDSSDFEPGSAEHIHRGLKCYTPEDCQKIMNAFNLCLTKGIPYDLEFPFLTFKGRQLWIRTLTEPVIENGKVVRIVGSFMDITVRIKAEQEIKFHNEELRNLNATKDKYFSIIAHDLRSPLSGFLGLTESMARGLPGMTLDEIHSITLLMKNSAANLFRLLGNLLEWSKMQRGLTAFAPVVFLLKPKICETIVLAQDAANSKMIEINCHIPDDLKIYADPNMLECILRNLVSNAVKFTPRGGLITVSAKSDPHQGIEISVADTGIGMSRRTIDNLFRLDANSGCKGTEGELSTGLGLVICSDFIEKHKGKLMVDSEEGIGSTFRFTLPNLKHFGFN